MFDERFWLAVSFFTFVYLVYKPLTIYIKDFSNNYIEKIRKEIEEVENIIGESSRRLAELKDRHSNIENEIQLILKAAEKEIANMKESSARDINLYLNKRSAQIIDKITSTESTIIHELKLQAIDIAIQVSKNVILSSKINKQKIIENSLENISNSMLS